MPPTLSPRAAEILDRTREFVRDTVIPVEEECGGVIHDAPASLRTSLQAAARAQGLSVPHLPAEWGGLGLTTVEQAAVFEAAGHSLLGPLALNIAAPDEGNMHLLEVVATEDQKRRYLAPLAAGEIRSCFAMTEPLPGAGSDPSALRSSAERTGAGWRINGRKWFISGADGAGFAICMARTSGAPGDRGGATMFLVDADNPGMRVVRNIETLDEGLFAGHSEVVFEDCLVTDDAVLGAADQGFDYAQVRLAPARLTHCMRWLGLAGRAQSIAVSRAATRELFGQSLVELGMVQQMIADSEIDMAASRALIRDAAEVIDSGARGGHESSIAKTFVAEAVNRVVDRAVQISGAYGISGDALLSRFYREVRPFRIYDGPSESHRWAIAKRVVRRELAAS